MKISASNIGWKKEEDEFMYKWMNSNRIEGLEIAPTRIFPENPYDRIKEAKDWADNLREEWNLRISSIQSIWYGRKENIFASKDERETLIDYTKRAIDFAKAINCHNLVFGCPRNRNMPANADHHIAEEFFSILGEYADSCGTVLAMEANPPIYNTNFCNTTEEAIRLIKKVNSPGFLLNLDVGTMVENGEDTDILTGCVRLINHVHISEPGLEMIKEREVHNNLAKMLKDNGYEGFVSLEIKTQDDVKKICNLIEYIASIFVS